jgi:lysyl-tRNA synthetase class 2
MPEKWHGLTDVESCYRQRYLDLIMSRETKERFLLKSAIVREIRRYLEDNSFIEVETPVLQPKPSGALAKPFKSHHEALDIDVYLRIAPETYLKRLIVGGFTKVFEFARCFRNEGISPTHLQDFTMIECYAAYWNYKDNMTFVRNMILDVINKVFGTTKLTIEGNEIDFAEEWEIVSFRELIRQDTGLDVDNYNDSQELLSAIQANNIRLGHENLQSLGKGNLIDQLYKKVSRPKIIRPTFLVEHPIELSPLARANDNDPNITDRFQLVINGAEIINAYSELVDPIEQRKRLEQQALCNAKGDEEAMVKDDDYISAMEYGMPPISGWGMGIERLVQVLTNCENIKDCVLFPLLRPLE